MSDITLTVNGRVQTVDVDPSTPLMYVLTDDLGLRGPKFGCGLEATLDRNPKATDAELRQALNGVLCRCFTHTRMMRAIRRYADARLRRRGC